MMSERSPALRDYIFIHGHRNIFQGCLFFKKATGCTIFFLRGEQGAQSECRFHDSRHAATDVWVEICFPVFASSRVMRASSWLHATITVSFAAYEMTCGKRLISSGTKSATCAPLLMLHARMSPERGTMGAARNHAHHRAARSHAHHRAARSHTPGSNKKSRTPSSSKKSTTSQQQEVNTSEIAIHLYVN